MAIRILLVDDEPLMIKGLKRTLEQDGYETDSAADGEEALKKLNASHYDLVLLDVMLPKLSGIEVCQIVRETSDIPIIMLTAKGEDMDKILGLEYGADDYITKPFSPTELLARVDSLYRRVEMHTPKAAAPVDDITLGEFVLNLRRRTLLKNGKNIELTQVEFQMIEYFFNNPDTALDRTDILEKVWGSNYFGEEKIVDVNIRRLRMKVEDDPSQPRHLVTVWGMGYKWNTK